MWRKRTVGDRIWIGLLSLFLFQYVVVDCALIWLLAVRWDSTPHHMRSILLFLLLMTWLTYTLLRRRLRRAPANFRDHPSSNPAG
jgi:hypothetical protein